jgi:hypothetical protein
VKKRNDARIPPADGHFDTFPVCSRNRAYPVGSVNSFRAGDHIHTSGCDTTEELGHGERVRVVSGGTVLLMFPMRRTHYVANDRGYVVVRPSRFSPWRLVPFAGLRPTLRYWHEQSKDFSAACIEPTDY